MKRVAIIGAGMTGAYLAYQLRHQNRVTVFEKARGVGGRMSTRYHEHFEFDHGVPGFKAIHPDFVHFLKTFEKQGVVEKWQDGYVAVPRMNQWVKVLLQDVELRTSTLVQKVDFVEGMWYLEDEFQQNLGPYDILISTAPPVQTAILLPDFAKDLKSLTLKPCYVLMLGIQGAFVLPTHATLDGLDKVVLNSKKPQRPRGTSLLIYMNASWSEQHLDMDLKTLETILTSQVLKAFKIEEKDLAYHSLHRWRYATGDQYSQTTALFWDEKKHCGVCGDWCLRGDVESAFLAASKLLKHISSFTC